MSEHISGIIQNFIEKLEPEMKEFPKLMDTFRNCYTNTWNTTVKRMEDQSVFVITGDIPAMWLRDSTAQLRPYLFLAKE